MKASFILILLLMSKCAKAQVLINGGKNYAVDGNVSILQEGEKPLTIYESWQYFKQNKFDAIATPNNDINLGFVKHFYWIAIPIKNTLSNNLTFVAGIDNGGIFHLEFYLVDKNGKLIDQYITGTNYDFDTRAIANRHFYFPINLDGGKEALIFYRIDMRGNGFHTPLRIVTKDFIDTEESKLAVFYAFFSGWLMFVAFFSLLAYIWIKDRVYIFYCLYVTSYCLFFMGDGNFDVELLYPHSSFMATISPTVYAFFMSFFMLLFMGDFLRLKTTHKKMFMLSRVFALLLIGAIILMAWGYVFSANIKFRDFIFYYCLFATAGAWVIQAYCIVRRICDGYRPAYLYGLALIGVFTGAALYVLHVLNIIPEILPTFVYVPAGFSIEIILLSFALVYSYTLLKNKHQKLLLDVANQKIDFSRQLLAVQEDEQKRIAEDLHDELGGNLAAIKMNLQRLDIEHENLNTVIQLIDKASGNARNIAHNLMPPEFEETKLEDLLQNFYNRLNREGNIRFDFIVSGTGGHFDKQQSLIIYRVLLELTNNIIKHSSASKATIQLVNDKGCLEIMAEDNGKGFTYNNDHGIGLKNIRSRIGFLKGDMNLDSSAGGTTIILRIPYKQ